MGNKYKFIQTILFAPFGAWAYYYNMDI